MKRPFLMLDHSRDVDTVWTISLDMATTLEIFGDPENACYEWCLVGKDDQVKQHSNCAYGSSSIALRDGLCAYHGLPKSDFITDARVKGDF